MRRSLLFALLATAAGPAGASVDWRAPVRVETEAAAVATAPPAEARDGESLAPTRARRPFFNLFAIQYRHSLYYPEVSGDASRSSKVERLYNEQNISFRTARSWGDILWTSQTAVRRSDDVQVAGANKNHLWDLLNLVTTLAKRDRWDVSFGNVLPNYHRYALSSPVEGLVGNYRWENSKRHRYEVSAGTGRAARGVDEIRFTRWVNGADFKWTSPSNWWGRVEEASLRASGSILHDDPGSIDRRASLAQVDARAGAARFELKVRGGYSLDADWGLSAGRQNILLASRRQVGGAFSSSLSYRRPFSSKTPVGWRKALPASWRGQVEVVGEDYFAPQASAGADQFRWALNAEHPFADWASYRWSLNRSEDNARRHRPVTNYNIATAHNLTASPFRAPLLVRWCGLEEDEMAVEPEEVEGRAAETAAAMPRPNFWKRVEAANLRLSLDFRRTGRYRTDQSVIGRTEDYSAGASHRIGPWSLGGLYAWQLVEDEKNAGNDRRSDNWSVTAGRAWRFERLDLVLQTNAGYRRGIDALRTGATSTRTENINAGVSAVWRGLTSGLDWSRGRTARNILGSNSSTQNARLNIGYRPPRFPGLDLRLTGSLQDSNEDLARLNFRTREVRLDTTYDF